MKTKKLKTKAWPDGRDWPDKIVLDVGSNMPTDVYGVDNPSAFGVLYIRHDVASKPTEQQGMKTAEEIANDIMISVFGNQALEDIAGCPNSNLIQRNKITSIIQQNAIASRDNEVWKCCKELANALHTAQMTVECASLDVQRGEELPWYKQMKSALAIFTALDSRWK